MLDSLPQHVLCHISLLQGGADNQVNLGPKVNGHRGGGALRGLVKVSQRDEPPQSITGSTAEKNQQADEDKLLLQTRLL